MLSVTVDGFHVCGGLVDGSIRVWSRSRLEQERTLTGHTGPVGMEMRETETEGEPDRLKEIGEIDRARDREGPTNRLGDGTAAL